MLDNPFSEEIFPNIQSKTPLVQLEAFSSCPMAYYLAEETDTHLATTSFQRATRSPLSLLFSRLNNPMRGPKLNTVFEVRPHQCRVQGHDHFLSPAGHTISDTSQDAIGLLGQQFILTAHIQYFVRIHTKTDGLVPCYGQP
ncbi:hypothetical protein QYF61_011998, partial [Mycteria americana]